MIPTCNRWYRTAPKGASGQGQAAAPTAPSSIQDCPSEHKLALEAMQINAPLELENVAPLFAVKQR